MRKLSQAICLKPAEALIGEHPQTIYTILGSCVCVIMHSPRLKITGITHALMPSIGQASTTTPLKYADGCVRFLHDAFRSRGVKPHELTVSVFGGSRMANQPRRHAWISVGELNVEVTLTLLRELGYPISHQETGGINGRKVFINCASGEVLLKRLPTLPECL
ncbi:chemotaxis protein CheD [Desulfurispirillum indicum]|uniref:Probable chemoreceptor glutamine deamidase CheD n=1 Tax=Desulfurispirillum indicum (strain ATCC BAA-1389 / DSM 22839 / S5) TaxID=653733 RepID=E6W0R3_DESIS|nr:chemotaxis protein CheD [Desulfurispirillum indicum]ADU66408.1 CheD family protein [Desulfurispirillum indicum S5]UCZ55740.1 chemotaxis protein CheD [Desulfurispirillum indicum]